MTTSGFDGSSASSMRVSTSAQPGPWTLLSLRTTVASAGSSRGAPPAPPMSRNPAIACFALRVTAATGASATTAVQVGVRLETESDETV